MTDIADRILGLLLFPLTDPRWVSLFHELDVIESPVSEKREGRIVAYAIPNVGVNLYTDGSWVLNVHFLVGPTYTCDLPFGLRRDFTIGDVHQLLGPPLSVRRADDDLYESHSYNIDHYRVAVGYSVPDETLLSVRLFAVGI
jgi:hypothetical protein